MDGWMDGSIEMILFFATFTAFGDQLMTLLTVVDLCLFIATVSSLSLNCNNLTFVHVSSFRPGLKGLSRLIVTSERQQAP